jgi:hypothetical protein
MTTLTPAATKILPEVVGKAIYLELSPILDSEGKAQVWQGADSILQVIVTPNGTDSTGKQVKSVMYDRIISKSYPRSQWESNSVEPLQSEAELIRHYEAEGSKHHYLMTPKIEDFEALPDEIKRDLYANGLSTKLRSLVTRSHNKFNEATQEYETTTTEIWSVSKKFAVEVTDEDLASIASWKTPQAVIRRINKVRDLA